MAKLARRGFLKQTTVGVATLGVLAGVGVPGLAVVSSDAPEIAETEMPAMAIAEPLIAHVRDFASGEISLMYGTQEIIYKDPEFVMRLLKAVV
jgi:hypothetical protein